MRIIRLTFFILMTSGTCSLGQTTISGKVISSINEKPLADVVVLFKGTTTGAVTDSLGNYQLNSPLGKVILSTTSLGYNRIDTTLYVTENLNVDFRLKAECNFNGQRAKTDITKRKLKLLLVGSIAPTANTNRDKRFMKEFNVEYYDFGDNVIAMECIEEYNYIIFDYMDRTYGQKWREKIRPDVIGLK